MASYSIISRKDLERRLKEEMPDNQDVEQGYALINVLRPEAFEAEHIPGSDNIPEGRENEFEQRFSKDKERLYGLSRVR